MKKFSTKIATLLLAVVLTTATSFSFANAPFARSVAGNSPNSHSGNVKQIMGSFHRDFRKAELLSSAMEANFIVVTFKENNTIRSAYYGENGQLLAVVHNIVSSQLPADLQADLKNNYGDYWITELFELNGDDQNGYYIALENADTKLTLRSTSDGSWEVLGSTAKK